MRHHASRIFRTLLPGCYGYYRRLREKIEARRQYVEEERTNRNRKVADVFIDVYRSNKWGGAKGEFFSGDGSAVSEIISPYLDMVREVAERENFMGKRFVDLGCGNFQVGQSLLPLCSGYIGVDVVEPLVRRNRELYGNASTQFLCMDIITGELPEGDVCFLRQVLQHLSNDEIHSIVKKLGRYRWVLITEHYPQENRRTRPNIDKVHGHHIRASKNSGVYLWAPPFRLPRECFEQVLEVEGTELEGCRSPGFIRTFLYRPRP